MQTIVCTYKNVSDPPWPHLSMHLPSKRCMEVGSGGDSALSLVKTSEGAESDSSSLVAPGSRELAAFFWRPICTIISYKYFSNFDLGSKCPID